MYYFAFVAFVDWGQNQGATMLGFKSLPFNPKIDVPHSEQPIEKTQNLPYRDSNPGLMNKNVS